MIVKYLESILYYDCELLFEAADAAGQRYIAVHDRDYESGCEYIVAPTDLENLAAFKAGQIGLRRLLQAVPRGAWYTARLNANTDMGTDTGEINLTPQPTQLADASNLLTADYYIANSTNPETI